MIIRLTKAFQGLKQKSLATNRPFTAEGAEHAEAKQALGLSPGSSGFSATSAISAVNKLVAFTAIGENRGCNFS